MRRFRIAIATAVLCLATAAGSEAALITFDDLDSDTVLDTEYSGSGVTFSNSVGSLRVTAASPGAPFSAPNSVLPSDFQSAGSYNQATFSAPVNFVSVVLGDFNDDADSLFLTAYDVANNVIASDTDFLAASVFGGLLLAVSAPDIAYVRFYAVGAFQGNNVYFDNFTFEAARAPEPAMLLLMATGLLGAGLRRSRRA